MTKLMGFAGILLLSTSVFAQEEPLPDRFRIEVGAFFVTDINSIAQASVAEGPVNVGLAVDFNRDLGLADSESIPRIDGYYRFSSRNAISFTFFDVTRGATRTLEREIKWFDKEFEIDDVLQSHFDQQTLRASWRYSIFHSPKAELAVSAGLHLTNFDMGIECISPTCTGADQASVDLPVPLPVIGFAFGYRISRRWDFSGSTEHFMIEVGGFDGAMTDTRINFSHHTFKNVGFGFGWNRIHTDLEVDTSDFLGSLNTRLDGLQAYVVITSGKAKFSND